MRDITVIIASDGTAQVTEPTLFFRRAQCGASVYNA